MVGGLTTVIWSVVGCCSGRWLVFSQPLVGGRWFPWSVVGYFLGKWSVVSGGCLVVGVTVIGDRWSVVCGWSVGFVLHLVEGSIFKVFSRWFLRVITHFENGNCFSSTLYNLTDIGVANEKSQVVTKVKKSKKVPITFYKLSNLFFPCNLLWISPQIYCALKVSIIWFEDSKEWCRFALLFGRQAVTIHYFLWSVQ